MTYNNKTNADLVQYLESMINLDVLDRMTNDLDDELKDSQRVMNEIRGMMDTLPAKAQDSRPEPEGAELRHEELSNFLTSGTPKLLLPDMVEITCDVNLDDIIASMRSYTEDLKKNFTVAESTAPVQPVQQVEQLDLEQYAVSLDVLCKRLNNLKLNKREEVSNLNAELDSKLALLCNDVNMFTQMVQAKNRLGEVNKEWCPTEHNGDVLNYDNLINKLLSGINEVTYLLQRKE